MVPTGSASVQRARRSSPLLLPGALVLDHQAVIRSMLDVHRQNGGRQGHEDDDEDGEEPGLDAASDTPSDASSQAITNGQTRRGKRSHSITSDRGSTDEARSASKSPAPAHAQASTSRVKPPSRDILSPDRKIKVDPFDGMTRAPPNVTFASLGLSQPLLSALETINIRKPTEIQAACIGPILQGQHCIGGAKTGSGKTMAFALPIVERIARDPYGIWAVVLTPTRELAYQLTEQFLVVGRPLGLSTVTIVGGMDMMAQATELELRPHIVVATPGRLCDLLKSDRMGGDKLSRVKVLVLDEADRLLTPSFAKEIGYIFSCIPVPRQTCLFTATISEPIMELANQPSDSSKRRPFVHRVASDTLTVAGLKQKYLFIPSQVRDPYLLYLLQHPPDDIDSVLRAQPQKEKLMGPQKSKKPKKKRRPVPDEEEERTPSIPSTIIFTQRCATAHLLHLLLNSLDIPSVPLHSHLTQPQRLQSLARFRAREIPVLVTTDVGSRGLDIPQVAMVVNWDCPRRSDDYVHRVGRTARAGRGGVAVTIVTERDVELVKRIEDQVGATMVELELPEEKVLEKLNAVSLARRMATMEMHDSGFGERQATNEAKQIKRRRRDAAL